MGRRVVALAACTALLAGCGGSKKAVAPEAPRYVRSATIKCLKKHHFTVSTKAKAVNFIAFTSVGGGLRAWKPKRHRKLDLIMAFGANGLDARQTLIAIKRFARRSRIFRYRIRKSNVVVLFAYRPAGAQAEGVFGCLKTAPKAS